MWADGLSGCRVVWMKGSSKCDSFQLLSTLGLPLPVAPHGSVMHEVDSSKRSLEIVCVNAARAPRCPDAVWHGDEGINRYYSILCGNIYVCCKAAARWGEESDRMSRKLCKITYTPQREVVVACGKAIKTSCQCLGSVCSYFMMFSCRKLDYECVTKKCCRCWFVSSPPPPAHPHQHPSAACNKPSLRLKE